MSDRDIVRGVLQTVISLEERVDVLQWGSFDRLTRVLSAVEVVQVVEKCLADIRLDEVGQLIVLGAGVAEILVVVNRPL